MSNNLEEKNEKYDNSKEVTITGTNPEPDYESKKKLEKRNDVCECGHNIQLEWNYCPYCKRVLKENPVILNNNKDGNKDNTKGTLYIAFSFICIILFFVFGFNILFLIGALFLTISAKISCSQNALVTVFFWLTIILLIATVLATIFMIVFCNGALNFVISCPEIVESCPG